MLLEIEMLHVERRQTTLFQVHLADLGLEYSLNRTRQYNLYKVKSQKRGTFYSPYRLGIINILKLLEEK